MYTQKEVLPTKRIDCGGFPCARKFEVGCLEVKIKLVIIIISDYCTELKVECKTKSTINYKDYLNCS